MSKNLLGLLVLLSACASNGGSGSTVSVLALFTLTHQGDQLLVYESKNWSLTSTQQCKYVRGELTDAELKMLRGYLDRASPNKQTHDCPTTNFWLTTDTAQACWDDVSANDAMQELTTFFNAKVAELASAPQGVCMKTIGTPMPSHTSSSTTPPPTRMAAGSGS